MGREIRRVPKDWEHPKQTEFGRGQGYKPLFGGSYRKDAAEYLADCIAWDDGTHETLQKLPERKDEYPFYWDYDGPPRTMEEYMPDWPEEERTHYQMYEDTTEGTPISPVMETPEGLARWLADNHTSAFSDDTATYEEWLAVCRGAYAPDAIFTPETGMISGVAATSLR